MTDTLIAPAPPLYRDPWLKVDTVVGIDPDGRAYPHRRVRITTGWGGVFICIRDTGDISDPEIAFVRVRRPAVGVADSLELPRGTTDDLGLDGALRELDQESGIQTKHETYLGMLYTDAGMLSNQMGVWLGEYASTRPGPVEHDVEWILLSRAIRDTRIKCGVTLAALMLLVRWIES